MKNESYFIVRDKNHSLWMYNCRPQRHKDAWVFPDDESDECDEGDVYHAAVELDTSYNKYHNRDLFKSLSFEDDPLELAPKKNNKYAKGKSYFVTTDDNEDSYLYDSKPYKDIDDNIWHVKPGRYCQEFLSMNLFEELTSIDDPIELILIDKTEPSVKEPSVKESSIKEPVKDCFDSIFDIKL